MKVTKQDMRGAMKALKQQLTVEQKEREAAAVFDTLEQLQSFKASQRIMLYCSLPDELPTAAAIGRWSKMEGKTLYLPRVAGNDIEVVPYCEGHMRTGAFGIAEPDGPAASPADLDLVIVPAMALDKHCRRLGRGRGYYDRLLAQCPAYTIGVALDCQWADEVPADEHDAVLCGAVTAQHIAFRESFTQHIKSKS